MTASPTGRRRFHEYQDLMRHRIMDILLVSTPYDTFILEEAGELSERMLGEFRNLDLHYSPGLTGISTGTEALRIARENSRVNLIITTPHLADMDAAELARRIQAEGLDVPVVLLAWDTRELSDFQARKDTSAIERTFLWQGDARILVSIVKSVEDWRNVEHDAGAVGVQVIILVEDNVRYYSSFLPVIYTELLHHSQRVIVEGLNLSQKILRMRARPKILLCTTWEEAERAFERYADEVLGIISDVEFPRAGEKVPRAGADFARQVRAAYPDVPIVLHSSRPENEALAHSVGADFLLKGSPLLLQELRDVMLERFGFGDFVFRRPDGTEVDRAPDLRGLEEKLRTVPEESIVHHAGRNHFSRWLKARTEFSLAHELRPRTLDDYESPQAMRESLIRAIAAYRLEQARTLVTDFDRDDFDLSGDFYRMGGGSLGGKARGLAFVRRLLAQQGLRDRFDDVEIAVPVSAVLGTDVFDTLPRRQRPALVRDRVRGRRGDPSTLPGRALPGRSRAGRRRLPGEGDVAARGSLVEPARGLAAPAVHGRLRHLMLANNAWSIGERVAPRDRGGQARLRLDVLPAREGVPQGDALPAGGREDGGDPPARRRGPARRALLPGLLGCRPLAQLLPCAADGGTGRSGRGGARHGPGDRRGRAPASASARATRGTSCSSPRSRTCWRRRSASSGPCRSRAGRGTAGCARSRSASRWRSLTGHSPPSPPRTRRRTTPCTTGSARPGPRLVTFAPVLKQGRFPLADVLATLMAEGERGMGTPVEIEFAVNLAAPARRPPRVRLRADAAARADARERGGGDRRGGPGARSSAAASGCSATGGSRAIRDLVVVDFQRFERARSREAAAEVGRLNGLLLAERTPYALVGVGRWGSRDPWLGIPVTWDQVSGAQVIVEAGLRDLKVTPSQGTHFFQNLTSFNVGYFTVNPESGDGTVDWDLARSPAHPLERRPRPAHPPREADPRAHERQEERRRDPQAVGMSSRVTTRVKRGSP